MSDFYKLTNSTSDFQSRSSDVFDKLANLEKQHDVHVKTSVPLTLVDDEAPSSSLQNPNIPNHAITFKKRPADDTFTRPENKWKKYDLDDVNEHHMSGMGNQYALNDYLRTRTKPSVTKEAEEETPFKPIFQRPLKKCTLTNEDDDDNDNHFTPITGRLSSNATEKKVNDDDDVDEEEPIEYKLKSIPKQSRGVVSKTEKTSTKISLASLQKEDDESNNNDGLAEKSSNSDAEVDYHDDKNEVENEDDDNDEDVDDEFFEP